MTKKKIIIACDGTWRNSDSGFRRTSSWFSSNVQGVLAVPTNITKLCRALETTHADGTPQLTYYQAGLGSNNNWYSFYVGGFLGEGVSENIREAYVFLCNNYNDGDEIYLVGFSRGAFTARSIGGLIGAIGLLTRKGLEDFYCIFRDWEFQQDPSYYKPEDKKAWIQAINIPDARRNYGKDPAAYVDFLAKNGLTRPNIPVEATAVFDTVGQLGIPTFVAPPLSWFQNRDATKSYAFINTEIPKNVRYAYQALALDERRTPFEPVIWELPPSSTKTELKELKQCWFAGVHCDVGGSYDDTAQADITMAWMMQQLSTKLSFNPEFLARTQQANIAWQKAPGNGGERAWSCGKIYRSDDTVTNALVGSSTRTPGEYTRLDPRTAKPTKNLLRKTHEFVHPSVRVRRTLGGLGTEDKGPYNDPWPLKDWTLVEPNGTFKAKNTGEYDAKDLWGKEFEDCWKWVKQAPNGKVTWIAEDQMDGFEWDLVAQGSKAQNLIRKS